MRAIEALRRPGPRGEARTLTERAFRQEFCPYGCVPHRLETLIHALALSGDYFDQAHFNKEFAEFSGLTPSAYVAALEPHVGVDLESGDVHFVPTESSKAFP